MRNTRAGSRPCTRCAAAPLLTQRPDDNEQTVARRLEVYDQQTRPLIAHYRAQGLLRTIDAQGGVDEVTARLIAALAAPIAVAPAARKPVRRKPTVKQPAAKQRATKRRVTKRRAVKPPVARKRPRPPPRKPKPKPKRTRPAARKAARRRR